jgi:uncharacterized HAD superfamily protein
MLLAEVLMGYNNNMRIGIDFDDVIADSMQVVVDLHNREYSTSYSKEDAASFYLEEIWGGAKEEWEEKLAEFLSTKYLADLNPMAGILSAMELLKENGHELYIISGRSGKQVAAAEKWIELHFPTTFNDVYCEHSSVGVDPLTKAERCKELGIDLMIEDSMHSARECAAADIRVFLFDQPWNRGDLLPNMTRVSSWDEIVGKIGQIV